MGRLDAGTGIREKMDQAPECHDCRYRVVHAGQGACPLMNAGDECPYGNEKADETL